MKLKHIVIAAVVLSVFGVFSLFMAIRASDNEKRAKFKSTAISLAKAEYSCAEVEVTEVQDSMHRLSVCGKTKWYRCKRSWDGDISCKEIKQKK